MPRFLIITLGCKVNQFESEGLAASLIKAGWQPASGSRAADLCIINTCTVTQKASMQARQAIRQAIRTHPGARIVVTGCLAQTDPDQIAAIPGVHHIVGQAAKERIPEILAEAANAPASDGNPRIGGLEIDGRLTFADPAPAAAGSRTRPVLKIQDGCNAFCTYCIVPHARGRSRSLPPDQVLARIRDLARLGFRETVLSGIHLGAYGRDLTPRSSLDALLARIIAEKAIERVRLSSIEPRELTDGILSLARGHAIICRHFHIPLQSGDDRILARMHRPYTRSLFRELVFKVHEFLPETAIGVDVLVGFPGESEDAFANTFETLADLPVAYLHVFPFSPRRGTPAFHFPDRVNPADLKARCRKIRRLGQAKRTAFYRRFIRQRFPVLVETNRDKATGLLKGMTSNYLPVLFEGADALKGRIVEVRAERVTGQGPLWGRLETTGHWG